MNPVGAGGRAGGLAHKDFGNEVRRKTELSVSQAQFTHICQIDKRAKIDLLKTAASVEKPSGQYLKSPQWCEVEGFQCGAPAQEVAPHFTYADKGAKINLFKAAASVEKTIRQIPTTGGGAF